MTCLHVDRVCSVSQNNMLLRAAIFIVNVLFARIASFPLALSHEYAVSIPNFDSTYTNDIIQPAQ